MNLWPIVIVVGFARGLNDTPKPVAPSLAVSGLNLSWSIALVAMFMAIGGLLHSRKNCPDGRQRNHRDGSRPRPAG